MNDAKELDPDLLLQQSASALQLPSTGRIWEDLVLQLSRALGVDWAFVGELLAGSDKRVQTMAVSHRGDIVENFEYSLDGSPSEGIFSTNPCLIVEDAQVLFPTLWLKAVGAKSYGRVTLCDSLGSARGVLVVAHSESFLTPKRVEAVLCIFAFKAAAEIERALADRHFYQELITSLPQQPGN